MALTIPKIKENSAVFFEDLKGQFSGLDPNNPAMWPVLPRCVLYVLVAVVVVVVIWFAWLGSFAQGLADEQEKEVRLRKSYQTKLTQAVNLETLKRQREQVQQYVFQLEKQLPSKAEMDALLSDISQAGLGRSLQFELFRPGQVMVKEYYAELPITVRVVGRYHDIGAFVSDVAHLSRIVTLNNLSISPQKDGNLVMDTTAKTFRYLDPEEVVLQRKATSAGKGGKK